ncbi:hypothetical protein A2773_07040 [Candidatus Gottesmanbacteria bacterium RIFCSPHIGHO2_01_FULL_39_10]|uniref:Short-chain dehydrogenase n=1 Tax=Candidatus Gottesmanbacteria bacterium RIFCSPHIGHO2_01_FULL_39_10 TaxID=1798375 RepID=A0A1F5ZQW0_9BACT|nr:MAG: hypothetical protein A2773_07040 [Candidatus Gottesmanbacteria bacterium RIFCSPHIGHO2_01_FULL_39_10]
MNIESGQKIALITGAASRNGFGHATVERFLKDKSYKVYAADKEKIGVDTFSDSGGLNIVHLDIRNSQEIEDVVERIIGASGKINVLVNNAGVMSSGLPHTYIDGNGTLTDELVEIYETNLAGPVILMKRVLENMRKAGGGTIVNVTSMIFHARSPFRSAYSDYKAIFDAASERIAREEEKNNIRVFSVRPGNHKTAIDRGRWTSLSDNRDVQAAQRLYNWWRGIVGGDPSRVGEVIYNIAEGKIHKSPVLVGRDAEIVTFLDEKFPQQWPVIFKVGHDLAIAGIKEGLSIMNRQGTIYKRK